MAEPVKKYRVVIQPAGEEAEFAIRSFAAQGYKLTHVAATQSAGNGSVITTVLFFELQNAGQPKK